MLSAFHRGQLSEIVGPWSSGAGSLLLALMAKATTVGDHVALVDAGDSFDPATANSAGTDLGRLLWVKCGGRAHAAWSATDLLVRCPGFALVALDLGEPRLIHRRSIPPSLWHRLKIAAEQSTASVVLRAPHSVAGSAAALVVSLRRREARWIGKPGATRLAGLTSEVQVLRSRARSHPHSPREGGGTEIQWAL